MGILLKIITSFVSDIEVKLMKNYLQMKAMSDRLIIEDDSMQRHRYFVIMKLQSRESIT